MVYADTEPRPSEESLLLTRNEYNNTGANKQASTRFILTLLILIILSLEFGDEVINPALTRVEESIYCRRYYDIHDPSQIGSDGHDGIKEALCKNSVIQGQVAMLKGWQRTLDAIGMLIFSIPWGHFADTYGRQPTMLIVTTSFWFQAAGIQLVCYFGQTLDLRLVWLSSLHTVFGGGSSVATAVDSLVAAFFKVSAASITTGFLAPLLSAWLMRYNPWIPMLLGLGIQIIPIILILFIPETMGYNNPPLDPAEETSSSDSSIHSSKECPILSKLLHQIKQSTAFLTADSRILLILPAFLIHMLFLSWDILLQYISTRYHITLSAATVLVAIRAGLIMLLCLFLLPLANNLFRTKWHIQPKHSDLLLSRFSAIAMAIGFLFIALAPSIPFLIAAMVVNTLGWGLMLFLRSLLTSLVEGHHVARLNTFVGMVDTVGLMVGSPALAWLFERGVEEGGMWIGLPFLACAGIVAVIAVVLGGIGVREEVGLVDGRNGDDF
ncbi:MFS general substrate transporter [Tothia fuscella]|uniref:MFS general substrate transporter n=1 Tax=Tothia fuscella TaxID=1048955 RepID=A0A9P4NVH1_9PEZI|nr:MFS general substrate transporter [Tothia fuscella]